MENDTHSEYSEIRNYYESLVFDEIQRSVTADNFSGGMRRDIACIALNQLPPRYIRSRKNMEFYMSAEERKEIISQVKIAVQKAREIVLANPRP